MAEHCQSCTEGIKNLKNRATREFYYEEERISDEHRAYLKSLTNAFPFSNNIYGEPPICRNRAPHVSNPVILNS